MKEMKTKLAAAGIILLVITTIGGCTAIDYKVFRAKFPDAGVGSYIWTKLTNK